MKLFILIVFAVSLFSGCFVNKNSLAQHLFTKNEQFYMETLIFDNRGFFYLTRPKGMIYQQGYGTYQCIGNKVILNTILNKDSLIWKLTNQQQAEELNFVIKDALSEKTDLTRHYRLVFQDSIELYYNFLKQPAKWENLDQLHSLDTLFLVSNYNDVTTNKGLPVEKDSLYTYTISVFYETLNSIILEQEILVWKKGTLWLENRPLGKRKKTPYNITNYTLKDQKTVEQLFEKLNKAQIKKGKWRRCSDS